MFCCHFADDVSQLLHCACLVPIMVSVSTCAERIKEVVKLGVGPEGTQQHVRDCSGRALFQ